MKSFSLENQADIIEAFNSTSWYLDDLLNIDTVHFKRIVDRVYPAELQLNKANSYETEALFLNLYLSIYNGTVSSKIYDKRDDFEFDIFNFPFLGSSRSWIENLLCRIKCIHPNLFVSPSRALLTSIVETKP